MMPTELLTQLSSLGIAGLLFVMWWYERQERVQQLQRLDDAGEAEARVERLSEELLRVVRANTEAITELRAELRAHRASEADWIRRLTQQVERIAPGARKSDAA